MFFFSWGGGGLSWICSMSGSLQRFFLNVHWSSPARVWSSTRALRPAQLSLQMFFVLINRGRLAETGSVCGLGRGEKKTTKKKHKKARKGGFTEFLMNIWEVAHSWRCLQCNIHRQKITAAACVKRLSRQSVSQALMIDTGKSLHFWISNICEHLLFFCTCL